MNERLDYPIRSFLSSFSGNDRANKEEKLTCGLVVTGELLDEIESLLSRLVYLPIIDFINKSSRV